MVGVGGDQRIACSVFVAQAPEDGRGVVEDPEPVAAGAVQRSAVGEGLERDEDRRGHTGRLDWCECCAQFET